MSQALWEVVASSIRGSCRPDSEHGVDAECPTVGRAQCETPRRPLFAWTTLLSPRAAIEALTSRPPPLQNWSSARIFGPTRWSGTRRCYRVFRTAGSIPFTMLHVGHLTEVFAPAAVMAVVLCAPRPPHSREPATVIILLAIPPDSRDYHGRIFRQLTPAPQSSGLSFPLLPLVDVPPSTHGTFFAPRVGGVGWLDLFGGWAR